MKRLSHFVVMNALTMCVLIGKPVTTCAESSKIERPSLSSIQPTSTPSVKDTDEAERGRRGRVQTQDGVAIGEIEDFLIEPEKGCIAYGVLTRTGHSTPDSFAILPWELMRPNLGDPTMSSFRLPGEPDLLGTAPHVSRAQWTTSAIPDWLGEVEQYWTGKGIQPCAIPTTNEARVIKASDVVGMDIQTDSGSNLGTIKELIMDGERGTITSVIAAQNESSSSIHRIFFALPWSRLHLNASNHIVVVHLGARTVL